MVVITFEKTLYIYEQCFHELCLCAVFRVLNLGFAVKNWDLIG